MNGTRKLFLLILLSLFAACGNQKPKGVTTTLSSSDRTKFLGRWAGNYTCPRMAAHPDTLIIAPGNGELDFSLTIHAGIMNPDLVTGHLTGRKEIMVTDQQLGGAPGSARISMRGDTLRFEQSGFDVTCSGDDYVIF